MDKLRAIDRRLLTILLIVFVQMLGAAMILPILPLYAQRAFAMEPETITLLVSSFFAAQFLAGPFLGRLSDNYGRLPVLIVSQIGTTISFIMLAAAPSAGILFAARILDGITGGNIIVAQAYITDITPREKRTESLGYIFAVFGLGFVFGPALGGILSAELGPRLPYLVAAGAAAVTTLLTWLLLEETITPEKQQQNRQTPKTSVKPAAILQNNALLIILIIAFVGQFALGVLQATFALFGDAVLFADYNEEATNRGIGLLLAAVGLGQLITQTALLRPLLRRFGEGWLVVLGTGVRAVSLLALAIISSPWPAALTCVTFAFAQGVMMPSLQSLATVTVEDEIRGSVLGVYQSSISLSTILSTAIAGSIFAINPRTPYFLGAAISAIVMIPGLFLVRQLGAVARKGRMEN